MALFSVSIALLLWHLDALTIPLFEYRSSVFPLDVVVVECPRVGWHQIALESAGGPRLLGLVDAAPALGARGVLCECHARGRATGDVQRVRAVAVGRFLVEALRPAGHPGRLAVGDVGALRPAGHSGRLAVGDVGAVVDAAPEDDEVLREAGHDLLARRGVAAADELKAHLAYETVATLEGWAGSTATAQAAVLSAAARRATAEAVRRFAPAARVEDACAVDACAADGDSEACVLERAYARAAACGEDGPFGDDLAEFAPTRRELSSFALCRALAPDPEAARRLLATRSTSARLRHADARLSATADWLARRAGLGDAWRVPRPDPLADTAPAAAAPPPRRRRAGPFRRLADAARTRRR